MSEIRIGDNRQALQLFFGQQNLLQLRPIHLILRFKTSDNQRPYPLKVGMQTQRLQISVENPGVMFGAVLRKQNTVPDIRKIRRALKFVQQPQIASDYRPFRLAGTNGPNAVIADKMPFVLIKVPRIVRPFRRRTQRKSLFLKKHLLKQSNV